jgi:hypothetical protein
VITNQKFLFFNIGLLTQRSHARNCPDLLYPRLKKLSRNEQDFSKLELQIALWHA